jgi:hypothetical protein
MDSLPSLAHRFHLIQHHLELAVCLEQPAAPDFSLATLGTQSFAHGELSAF